MKYWHNRKAQELVKFIFSDSPLLKPYLGSIGIFYSGFLYYLIPPSRPGDGGIWYGPEWTIAAREIHLHTEPPIFEYRAIRSGGDVYGFIIDSVGISVLAREGGKEVNTRKKFDERNTDPAD